MSCQSGKESKIKDRKSIFGKDKARTSMYPLNAGSSRAPVVSSSCSILRMTGTFYTKVGLRNS